MARAPALLGSRQDDVKFVRKLSAYFGQSDVPHEEQLSEGQQLAAVVVMRP